MGELETGSVLELLPHRWPFLHIDRILKVWENGCSAMKNISYGEPCFQGHFQENPVFPGVLIVEALAQTCSLWLSKQNSGVSPVFAGIRDARFLKMVRPGDQLCLTGELVEEKKGFYTFQAEASVDGATVCEARLTIVQRPWTSGKCV